MRFRGEKIDLPQDAFLSEEDSDGDVYVVQEVLEQIWPMLLDINLSSLILKVSPDRPLPFQQRKNRKTNRDRVLAYQAGKIEEEQNFPFIPYPYQLVGKPIVDISGQVGFDETSDDVVSQVSVSGVNDLAYASADYSVSYARRGDENQKPENLRFRLRRQNIHEGALPFGLEDTQLGDVRLNNRELIASNSGGRGFIFSTEDNDKSGAFDNVTIDGVSIPGWEVELYLNDELLLFDVVDQQGEYRFDDIPVGFGNNRFRVVLYGPQGQIRERVENYIFQSAMLKKGVNSVSGGILEAEKDLFPIEERRSPRAEGLTANVYAARGLFDRLTGFVSASTIKDRINLNEDSSREYVTAGAIGSVGTTLAQLEAYKQLDGGSAVDVRTVSDFFGFKINTEVSAYNDFISPKSQDGPNRKTLETDFSVKKIFRTLVGALGLEFRYNLIQRDAVADTSNYFTRQSFGLNGLRLTNSTRTALFDGEHQTTAGRITGTTRYNRWNFRNSLGYNIHPELEPVSIRSELRYGRSRDYSYNLFANYDFNDDEKRLGFQISRDFDTYLGSAETDWSSDGGFGFMLRASTSIGPYDQDEGYIARSKSFSNVGPIASTVFRDKNYDGIYNGDDEPVEAVKIDISRKSSRERTDEDGYLMDFVSASGKVVDVKVKKTTIQDPYLISAAPGYSVYPRPGAVHKLDFPLIETGAIDGTMSVGASGEPMRGVTLELLNEEGDVIQTTKTAADGYYTFERIPPGDYTIRPEPSQGIDIPFEYVSLQPGDMFKFGTDVNGVKEDTYEEQDLDTRIAKDGTVNVKDIISLAKGYKDKKRARVYKASTGGGALKVRGGVASGQSIVKEVRIGDYPDKVRMVIDLSNSLEYSIDYDPQSKTVTVDMPFASWQARENWQSKNRNVLNNYRVQKTKSGAQMIIGVEDNVEIGASGLLKPDHGKSYRLYIDIEKQ